MILPSPFENHVSFEGIEAFEVGHFIFRPFENHVSFEGIEAEMILLKH